MKVNGKIVSNMVKEPIFLLIAMLIQVNINKANLMGLDNTNGKMVVFTLESSKMV